MGQTNPKDSSRIRGDARARREQRRVEAAERQAEHDKRTAQDQLRLLSERRGMSERERERLHKLIENGGAHKTLAGKKVK